MSLESKSGTTLLDVPNSTYWRSGNALTEEKKAVVIYLTWRMMMHMKKLHQKGKLLVSGL